MKFRRLDNSGDWTFGLGFANLATDNEAIVLNVRTRILSFKNDWFLDTEAGIDWFYLLGNKDTEKLIKNEIERVVLNSDGVTKINKIEIIVNDKRRATINIEFDTIYETNNELGLQI